MTRGLTTRQEQVLVPARKPGDIVIIDNFGGHKGSSWKRIGALLQTFTTQDGANRFRNAGDASI
jgi:hypothetical protein